MAIGLQNLVIYQSQNMGDTDSSGGSCSGTVIQDGASNSIFPDVSPLDRVTGKTRRRKIFAGVDSADNEVLIGAFLFVSKIPADTKIKVRLYAPTLPGDWHGTLPGFAPSYLHEVTPAVPATAAGDALDVIYDGELYTNHSAGGRAIMIAHASAVAQPVAGDKLALITGNTTHYCTVLSEISNKNFVYGDTYYVWGAHSVTVWGSVSGGSRQITVVNNTPGVGHACSIDVNDIIGIGLNTNIRYAKVLEVSYKDHYLPYTQYDTLLEQFVTTDFLATVFYITLDISMGNDTGAGISDLGQIPAAPAVIYQVLPVDYSARKITTLEIDNPLPRDFPGTDGNRNGIEPLATLIYTAKTEAATAGTDAVTETRWYKHYATQPLAEAVVTGGYAFKVGDAAIINKGDVIVALNNLVLTGTYTSLATTNIGRTAIDRLIVRDYGNQDLDAALYTANLETGMIVWGDLTGVSQPLTITARHEDVMAVASVDLETGTVTTSSPATHDYGTDSLIASALVLGDLSASVSPPFEQATWTGVWQDTRIGANTNAQFNHAHYPIAVINKHAITQKWMVLFVNSTTFHVYGESVGQIVTSAATADTVAPVNPATNGAYFTIPAGGWGAGWAAGNVLRFNTTAANYPVLIAEEIQSGAATSADFNFCLELRGGVNA